MKKVGALVGKQVTKKTVEKTITKAVPLVGGVISGGLTYVTFGSLGHRLADTLVMHLNGEFDDVLELNPGWRPSPGVKSTGVGSFKSNQLTKEDLHP